MCQKMICLTIGLLSISSFFILTGCSHVAGNVVPENGPTMENIYDDNDLGEVHTLSAAPVPPAPILKNPEKPGVLLSPARVDSPTFLPLDNPSLTLYIFPHLAGSELLPIPGYWTAFPAYSRPYYALPLSATSIHANETQEKHQKSAEAQP